jgi:hypothetical protein
MSRIVPRGTCWNAISRSWGSGNRPRLGSAPLERDLAVVALKRNLFAIELASLGRNGRDSAD